VGRDEPACSGHTPRSRRGGVERGIERRRAADRERSDDGTVRLWDALRGTASRTLRSDRPYERLDITGLTGVTGAQRATLLPSARSSGRQHGAVPTLSLRPIRCRWRHPAGATARSTTSPNSSGPSIAAATHRPDSSTSPQPPAHNEAHEPRGGGRVVLTSRNGLFRESGETSPRTTTGHGHRNDARSCGS
jgi:hypothetical protein